MSCSCRSLLISRISDFYLEICYLIIGLCIFCLKCGYLWYLQVCYLLVLEWIINFQEPFFLTWFAIDRLNIYRPSCCLLWCLLKNSQRLVEWLSACFWFWFCSKYAVSIWNGGFRNFRLLNNMIFGINFIFRWIGLRRSTFLKHCLLNFIILFWSNFGLWYTRSIKTSNLYSWFFCIWTINIFSRTFFFLYFISSISVWLSIGWFKCSIFFGLWRFWMSDLEVSFFWSKGFPDLEARLK